MALSPNDEGRPPGEEERPRNVVSTDTYSVPRCVDCGRIIRAAMSLRTGLGKTCRRRRAGVAA